MSGCWFQCWSLNYGYDLYNCWIIHEIVVCDFLVKPFFSKSEKNQSPIHIKHYSTIFNKNAEMCVNSKGVWGIMLVKSQAILAEFLHFSSYREGLGWLLKLGEETLSFEWTPGKSIGSAFAWTEYLSLSMLCQKLEISWKHRWSIFGHQHQQDDWGLLDREAAPLVRQGSRRHDVEVVSSYLHYAWVSVRSNIYDPQGWLHVWNFNISQPR